ncbi:hypothetical protein H632_c799p1 [Helicosporidium sp. ATCC 50920]|nr:hypothetical protein H632_c799p1 [Helicosporidium sp. ATCC 50920]|eukprot:KDD75223.1 hypothetical protein H632_c799p1 [Helicosporidium sp. ATCC 50920]
MSFSSSAAALYWSEARAIASPARSWWQRSLSSEAAGSAETAAPAPSPPPPNAILFSPPPHPPTAGYRSQQIARPRRLRAFDEKGSYGEQLFAVVQAKDLHISPRKLNEFAKVVRNLGLQDAIVQCRISIKKSARMVHDALMAARKSALEDNGLDAEKLSVAEAWVGKGQYLRRVSYHAKGVAGRRHRYRSHLTIVLKQEPEAVVPKTRIVPMLAERRRSAGREVF